MTDNRLLRDLVVQDLPRGFLADLLARLEPLYQEAAAQSFNGSGWGESEAEYMRPHTRRALFEALFRKTALNSGLQATVEVNSAKNTKFTLVQTQHLMLTASCTAGPIQTVRPARFREQHASLNRRMPQRLLQFMEEDQEVAAQKKLYGIILHGPNPLQVDKPGFLKIGFPSVDGDRWVDHFDFQEILAAMPEEEKENIPAERGAPVWRRNRGKSKG